MQIATHTHKHSCDRTGGHLAARCLEFNNNMAIVLLHSHGDMVTELKSAQILSTFCDRDEAGLIWGLTVQLQSQEAWIFYNSSQVTLQCIPRFIFFNSKFCVFISFLYCNVFAEIKQVLKTQLFCSKQPEFQEASMCHFYWKLNVSLGFRDRPKQLKLFN